jgi:hypothetical protein
MNRHPENGRENLVRFFVAHFELVGRGKSRAVENHLSGPQSSMHVTTLHHD